jgi:hypothetical protein
MISKDKTYRTRDGREVRIYATDVNPFKTIHGASKSNDGLWFPHEWLCDGSHPNYPDTDLIEVKPRIKRTVWLNVFGDHVYGAYTKEGVDIHPYVDSRLACVKVEIDCEEGEGL